MKVAQCTAEPLNVIFAKQDAQIEVVGNKRRTVNDAGKASDNDKIEVVIEE
jgi:hypothetical protein